jgi:hypothetical protein
VPKPTIDLAAFVTEAPKPGKSGKKSASAAPSATLPRGIRIMDRGLLTRLQAVANEFKGKPISVVSGYRPTAKSGYHKEARALDVHVEGVRNEDLVTFCRSLSDTGCGYYPHSSFVHMDVRPAGTGHVYWIDASGPGEPAKYVSAWPPPKDTEPTIIARPDAKAPSDEQTHGDAKDDARGDTERDRDSEPASAGEALDENPYDAPSE